MMSPLVLLGFRDGIAVFDIPNAAFRAHEIFAELDAAAAHPAPDLGGASVDHGVGGHVAGHDASGAHEGILPEGGTTDYGRICADGCAAFHEGALVLVLSLDEGAWVDHVREDTGGPAEDLVLDDHVVIDGDVVLDLDAVSYYRCAADVDVLPDRALLADLRAAHDVAEVPDLRPGADLGALIDVCRFVLVEGPAVGGGDLDEFLVSAHIHPL